jgi:hypothetical protein
LRSQILLVDREVVEEHDRGLHLGHELALHANREMGAGRLPSPAADAAACRLSAC